MKKFVSAVLLIFIFASCSKQDLAIPAPEADLSATTGANLYYKDANVAIANVQAVAVGNHVEFRFTSLYEKNVERIEVMSGPYENMLCFFYAETLAATSLGTKNYTVTEENAAKGIRFYVIKYTLKSGGWIMTPALRYQK